jgi:hypothetical protein
MKVTTLHNPAAGRGGMSANAFGGQTRLDKCDLMGPSLLGEIEYDVTSDVVPERTLWLTTIKDSCDNYLMWGLGRNGTSAPEFWYAAEFLFHTRASVGRPGRSPGSSFAHRIQQSTARSRRDLQDGRGSHHNQGHARIRHEGQDKGREDDRA